MPKLVRLSPGDHACRRCGSVLKVPHDTIHDCETALHLERAGVLKRAHEITVKRAALTKQRMAASAKKQTHLRKRHG